jgi:hypothetical protein
MLWLYAGAAGLGLLLGLRFRVGAVIAASAVLVMASAILGPLLAEWSVWMVLSAVFGGPLALQCGYFAGLLLMCALSRASSADARERLVGGYRALTRSSRALKP